MLDALTEENVGTLFSNQGPPELVPELAPEPGPELPPEPDTSDISDNNPEQRLLRGSVVCFGTFSALAGMLGWLGHASPDPGDRLVASGSMFDDVSAHIAALGPDGGWQGSAAQAYLAQILAQSQRAKLMRDLDRRTRGLVSTQAQAVADTRAWLIHEMIIVAAVGISCLALEESGLPGGQQVSLAVAVVVCTAALGVAIYKLVWLKHTTSQNAHNLQGLTQRLTAIATTSPTLPDAIPGLPDVPAAPSPITGPPDDTGPLPKTPDISLALADLTGSPEFSVSDLPRPGFPDFGAPGLAIPEVAGLPHPATASELAALPDFSGALAAVPTMAQLTAALGQLTGLSGAAGGLSQLTTMAGQQAQMISALAQQGTQQHASLADQVTKDDDNAGAAAGATTAEHAPVDDASRSLQRRQRVL
ncbi:hypothetical protein A4G30_14600 [Mycobacterium kansasii]|nr:hypothetical protein A4G30_14600 [Mycobacterium kansasii]POX72369.1 hypothetical protein C3475_16255 [Mycobacterium kansasii]POX83892.1 hypothetical protein C3470_11175 [Mycobacterium kansasii]POX93002.1 hypothetical protein C3473_18935 [Mycobacterium kansasii]POY09544.1 hypothetical protein C3474_16720 [Mycobacterium kansasii]